MKYSDLHYGQIPTSYKAVKSEALNSGVHAIFSLLKCFAYTIDSGDYMLPRTTLNIFRDLFIKATAKNTRSSPPKDTNI